MTNEEALAICKKALKACEFSVPDLMHNFEPSEATARLFEALSDSEDVRFIALCVEKNIPQKTIATEDFVCGCCPRCERYVDNDNYISGDFLYCPYCGQRITVSGDSD